MKRSVQYALSLGCAALVLYAVFHQFNLQRTVVSLRSVHPGLLATGIALMIVAYLLRGARWTIWERGLRYWDSLRLILIGFMGNNILPARLGEILRAHCTSAQLDRDRGRTAVLASIAAERILDGLVLSVFGLIGIALVQINARLRLSLLLISVVFAIFTFLLIFSIRFHETIRIWLAALNRKFPGHLSRFTQQKASHFLNGLLPLGSFSRVVGALLTTGVIWSIELGCYYFVGLSVWPGMSVRIALLFLVVVNFASLIPVTIGGIGTIEAIAVTFLISSGIPQYPALAMILLQHAAQYFFTTISGAILYLSGGFVGIPIAEPKPKLASNSQTAERVSVIDDTRSSLGRLGEQVALKPGARNDIQLSIVIPAYNEQARLPRTVLETLRWCTAQKIAFELIISDDGSRDETLSLARLFEDADARVRALACPHMGKGSAVRMGMLNAKGRYILFMDADGATPLDEVTKLIAQLDSGHDVAVGSRVMQQPGEVEVKTPVHRKIIGRIFALFVNLFAVEGIGDTQCGFKMFRRESALAVFSRQKLAGFAFDVEVLFIARRMSMSIAEVPVNWVAQAGSKVNLITDSMKMLRDITLIRWLHRGFQVSNPPQHVSQERHENTSEISRGMHQRVLTTN